MSTDSTKECSLNSETEDAYISPSPDIRVVMNVPLYHNICNRMGDKICQPVQLQLIIDTRLDPLICFYSNSSSYTDSRNQTGNRLKGIYSITEGRFHLDIGVHNTSNPVTQHTEVLTIYKSHSLAPQSNISPKLESCRMS